MRKCILFCNDKIIPTDPLKGVQYNRNTYKYVKIGEYCTAAAIDIILFEKEIERTSGLIILWIDF